MYGYLFQPYFRPYTALFHPVRLLKFNNLKYRTRATINRGYY